MLKRLIPLILGIVLIVTGIIFMAVLPKKAESKKARCTADTIGKVTDCVEQYGDDGTTYDITISFEVDGKSYTDVSNQSQMENIGAEFDVHYNPDNPDDYVIDGISATPKTFFISGLAILVVGIVLTLSTFLRLARGR